MTRKQARVTLEKIAWDDCKETRETLDDGTQCIHYPVIGGVYIAPFGSLTNSEIISVLSEEAKTSESFLGISSYL